MTNVPGWVVRRRVALLAGALLTAVASEVLLQTVENDRVWDLLLTVSTLLPIALIVWSYHLIPSFDPATLVACPGPPAFQVPVNPGVVLNAAGYTFLGAKSLGILMRDVAAGDDLWFAAGIVTVWIGLLALQWLVVLGRFGVQLRPDGIVDRQVFGSVRVPWEALADPWPATAGGSQQVTLLLADRGLMHRRGLRIGRLAALPAPGVSGALLARAICEYVNRPDLRPAIGSDVELARLNTISQRIAPAIPA